jgi:dehydratase
MARLFQHGSARLTLTAAAGLTAVLGSAAVLSAPAASASALLTTKSVSVTFNLKVTAGSLTDDVSETETLTTTAPATVAPSGHFIVSLSSAAISIPASVDGITITDIKSLSLKVKVPANSTYASCSFTGGSGFGTGTPTCADKSGTVTFSVPGPIDGGTTVTLPTLGVHLKAGTTAGDSIKSKLAGTSYTSPCLSGTANVVVLGSAVVATAVGYPSPSPVLTTTKIS